MQVNHFEDEDEAYARRHELSQAVQDKLAKSSSESAKELARQIIQDDFRLRSYRRV